MFNQSLDYTDAQGNKITNIWKELN
jgi:hypothetical protein